jgi:hypothetical protein
MKKRREQRVPACPPHWIALSGLAILLSCILITVVPHATASPPADQSDFESIYDPGIPPAVSVEWSFPTGFALGIDSGYQLRIRDADPSSSHNDARMNQIPLTFLMKYSLYEGRRISQSVGFGMGPYFFHQGQMPIQLEDVDITGSSTALTEWVSHLSKDLYVNLRMRYTQAFQFVVNDIPLWDFTTWFGMNLRW